MGVEHGYRWEHVEREAAGPREGQPDVSVLYVDGVEVGRVAPSWGAGQVRQWSAYYGDTLVDVRVGEPWGLYDKLVKYAATIRPLGKQIEAGDFLLLSFGAGTQIAFVDLGGTDRALVIWRLSSPTREHPGYWAKVKQKLSRNDPRIIRRLGRDALPIRDDRWGGRWVYAPEESAVAELQKVGDIAVTAAERRHANP